MSRRRHTLREKPVIVADAPPPGPLANGQPRQILMGAGAPDPKQCSRCRQWYAPWQDHKETCPALQGKEYLKTARPTVNVPKARGFGRKVA